MFPGLCHAAKRRPNHAHDPTTIASRIELIHDRVDEHPFVPVALEQDYSEAFAKFKLLFPDASRAAGVPARSTSGRRPTLKSAASSSTGARDCASSAIRSREAASDRRATVRDGTRNRRPVCYSFTSSTSPTSTGPTGSARTGSTGSTSCGTGSASRRRSPSPVARSRGRRRPNAGGEP